MRSMSTASYLETAIVIGTRFGEPGGRELDLWLHRAGVDLVGVDADQADAARIAYRIYGKGRHLARLNFGDCFSYGLAKISGQPLLFKGDDLFTPTSAWFLVEAAGCSTTSRFTLGFALSATNYRRHIPRGARPRSCRCTAISPSGNCLSQAQAGPCLGTDLKPKYCPTLLVLISDGRPSENMTVPQRISRPSSTRRRPTNRPG